MRKNGLAQQEWWCGRNLKSDTPLKKVCLGKVGTPDTPLNFMTH
jgi:hypothetical protein